MLLPFKCLPPSADVRRDLRPGAPEPVTRRMGRVSAGGPPFPLAGKARAARGPSASQPRTRGRRSPKNTLGFRRVELARLGCLSGAGSKGSGASPALQKPALGNQWVTIFFLKRPSKASNGVVALWDTRLQDKVPQLHPKKTSGPFGPDVVLLVLSGDDLPATTYQSTRMSRTTRCGCAKV